MVYCWTCGDYALCLNLWRLCSTGILCLHFLWLPLYYFPACAVLNVPLISFFFSSLILYLILFSLSSQFPSVVLHPSLLSLYDFVSVSPLHSPPSSPPPLLRASGCLPTSDVLLARWCMHISCVFLTLTHVDICTALWDYALGHISCNDENDDGDEDSGRVVVMVCVCVWGGASIFCPCLFFNINQCSEIRWNNWAFTESVEGITSFGRVWMGSFSLSVSWQQHPFCYTKLTSINILNCTTFTAANPRVIWFFLILAVSFVHVMGNQACMNTTLRWRDRKWKSSLAELHFPCKCANKGKCFLSKNRVRRKQEG